jgi:hypothetical protein
MFHAERWNKKFKRMKICSMQSVGTRGSKEGRMFHAERWNKRFLKQGYIGVTKRELRNKISNS